MASNARTTIASAVGWAIAVLVVIWLLAMVIGWIGFVLRSLAWLVVIAILVAVYFKLKEPPDI